MTGGSGPRWTVLTAGVLASVVLLGAYLALGGATYKPLEVADPCDPRPEQTGAEERGLAEDLALSALDGAACALRVPREELALALATPEARAEFGEQYNLSDEEIESAVDSALARAVDDAEAEDRLSGFEAEILRRASDAVPVGLVIDALQTGTGESVLGIAEDLLREQLG